MESIQVQFANSAPSVALSHRSSFARSARNDEPNSKMVSHSQCVCVCKYTMLSSVQERRRRQFIFKCSKVLNAAMTWAMCHFHAPTRIHQQLAYVCELCADLNDLETHRSRAITRNAAIISSQFTYGNRAHRTTTDGNGVWCEFAILHRIQFQLWVVSCEWWRSDTREWIGASGLWAYFAGCSSMSFSNSCWKLILSFHRVGMSCIIIFTTVCQSDSRWIVEWWCRRDDSVCARSMCPCSAR